MKEVHANTVGNNRNTNKSIYVIKNDINNKLYVGQTSDVQERFRQHCKNCNDSLIGDAIKLYGKEYFWVETLEENVSDPDAREMYWIEYLGTRIPNGYNIMTGGLGAIPQTKLIYSEELVLNIKNQLKRTTISLQDIANANGISKRQVLRINQGLIYSSPYETYPIREIPNINGKLTEEDVDSIIELLKYTYYYDGYIAKLYGVEVHAISKINKGITHRRDDIKYPIRDWKSCGVCPFTYEDVTDIMYQLKYTDLSMNQIRKRYNVNVCAIMAINNGSSKKYRRDGVKYPIRRYRDKQHYDYNL